MIFHRPLLVSIKTAFVVIFLLCVYSVNISAQCVPEANDDCVSVRQSTLDRAMRAINELTEARKAIEALKSLETATNVEKQAYKNALEVSASAIEVFKKGVEDRDRLIALQDKVILAMSQLNEKLIQQMGKKPSAWTKFVNALKTISQIAFGIGIGRAL